jgi:hypothetical protein
MAAVILAFCLIAAPQVVPAVPAQPVPNFHVEVHRVELAVSVTDRKSHQPALGLHPSDFQVFDDGHPVQITHFEPPGRTRPFMVWLLFRNDYLDRNTLPKIEAEMPAALDALPSSAWVGVASYSVAGSVLWLSPQPSRTAVLQAIHRLVVANPDVAKKPPKKSRRPPAPAVATESAAPPPEPAPVDEAMVKHPMKEMFRNWDMGPSGGLRLVMKDWATRRDSGFLPVVVIVSDEMSFDYVWSAERLKNELLRNDLTLDELEEPHGGFSHYWVTISKIYAPTGIPLDPGGQIYRYRYETYLAAATGGEVVAVKAHDYRAGFEHLFRDLNNIYAVEFAPPKIDGKWHNISVKLNPRAGLRPGSYTIRVRKRYFAGPAVLANPAPHGAPAAAKPASANASR